MSVLSQKESISIGALLSVFSHRSFAWLLFLFQSNKKNKILQILLLLHSLEHNARKQLVKLFEKLKTYENHDEFINEYEKPI